MLNFIGAAGHPSLQPLSVRYWLESPTDERHLYDVNGSNLAIKFIRRAGTPTTSNALSMAFLEQLG